MHGKDYFEELAKKNKVEFVRVIELEFKGEEEKIRKYIEDRDTLDKYHILRIETLERSNPKIKCEVEFPIFETRKEIKRYLRRLIKDASNDGIETYICGKGEIKTKKMPYSKYPVEIEKRLIDKYKGREPKKSLLELEYGIKL